MSNDETVLRRVQELNEQAGRLPGNVRNNGWISVKDRLPESEEVVLGYLSGDVILMRCIIHETTTSGIHRWYSLDHQTYYSPSHWQPLPDPPPRQSSFDEWWANGVKGRLPCFEDDAKFIWDAAVKACQSPDYVP